MAYTIKNLQSQWLSKTLIYEALKTVLPFSKQFQKNKRIFDEKDLEIFKYYKEYGIEQTVSKYWTSQNTGDSETVSKQSWNSNKNSFKTVQDISSNTIKEEKETVQKQSENREVELLKIIDQKDELIKVKDEQTQKYALLKQEEKKEKEDWIKKYDNMNNNYNDLLSKLFFSKTINYTLFTIITLIFVIILLLLNWKITFNF